MLGIIGAMEVEVAALKEAMSDSTIEKKAEMEFCKGKLDGKPVVVVRSGIGKVNAAICAQILVDCFRVSAVVNTGVAGSLNAGINIGDIVLSKTILQHDMDATGFGYAPGVIPQMSCSVFEGDADMIRLAKKICETEIPEISAYEGRIVSGDQFISDKKVKARLVKTFAGDCCEMEGAAIAQAAYLDHIPFLIIRAISDKADDSAHMDYPTFEAQAAEHSFRLVRAFAAAWE